jgi:hypothetical protein
MARVISIFLLIVTWLYSIIYTLFWITNWPLALQGGLNYHLFDIFIVIIPFVAVLMFSKHRYYRSILASTFQIVLILFSVLS